VPGAPATPGPSLLTQITEIILGMGQVRVRRGRRGDLHQALRDLSGCPNLASPPSTTIYKMIGAIDDSKKICRLCGWVVSRKAKLPREACPDADPELPGMNRWGEPMRTAARTQSGDAGKAA